MDARDGRILDLSGQPHPRRFALGPYTDGRTPGAFTRPRTIRVELNGGGTRQVTGEVVVIDTGCRPARPDLPGLDGVPWLDSTGILGLDAIPEHLLVLGGGYIGVEFAQMFRRFGSRVTLVQKGGQLLPTQAMSPRPMSRSTAPPLPSRLERPQPAMARTNNAARQRMRQSYHTVVLRFVIRSKCSRRVSPPAWR